MDGQYNFDPMTGEPIAKNAAAARRTVTDPADGIYSKKAKRKRDYSAKEKAMAWLSVLIGYLFCRTFWIWQKPAVGLLFALCLFAFAFVFFGMRKRKARSLFYPVSAIIISSALFFSSSPVLLLFVFVYVCAAFVLYCQTGSETALEGRAGQLFVFETVKAFFVSPFKSIGSAIGAAGANKGGKKIGKTLLIILIGVALTAVPTLAVMWLLSFDSGFTGILDKIRLDFFSKFFSHFLSLVFGLPVGMYIYAALYTSAHPVPDAYNKENCEKIVSKMKFAPSLVGAVAILPLLFLYGIFIAAQAGYYKAILTSTLPDAYTFAEFARDGFFRLCAVAAINAAALVLLRVFTRKTAKGKISPVVKAYTVILSLLTVIISATAISQMVMYVSAYGLTRLRLYTLWFMALLILMFLLTVLKQFIEKLPFAASAIVIFALCFGLLAVPDTDAVIARHNYDCRIAGTTNELDVDYLGKLSPSSVPVLCEIAGNADLTEDTRRQALAEIGRYDASAKHPDDLPSLLARRAYAALDRETQLRAAVEYDALCPHVFFSAEKQSFRSNGTYYEMTVCFYDKREDNIFTGNPLYAPLKPGEESEDAAKMIREYAEACKAEGKEYLPPFAAEDFGNEGRFYVGAGYDFARGGNYPLYIYDSSSGCLAILQLAA